jgi:hypothetical protein
MSVENLARMLLETGERIEVSAPPQGAIESQSRRLSRNRKAAVATGTAVIGVGLVAGFMAFSGARPGSEIPPVADPQPPVHSINVRTLMGDTEFGYLEGALVQVEITANSSSTSLPVDPYSPAAAPWERSWNELKPGSYTLSAAVRPCDGNCGYLDPPVDSCEQTLVLDGNKAVEVTFLFGHPCRITVTADDRPDAGKPNPTPINLPTNEWHPGGSGLTAQISGVLSVDQNDCVYLAGGEGSRRYVTWPAGYSATIDSARHLTLFNQDGEPVAQDGDRLNLGGGYARAPAGSEATCLPNTWGEIGNVMSEVMP